MQVLGSMDLEHDIVEGMLQVCSLLSMVSLQLVYDMTLCTNSFLVSVSESSLEEPSSLDLYLCKLLIRPIKLVHTDKHTHTHTHSCMSGNSDPTRWM